MSGILSSAGLLLSWFSIWEATGLKEVGLDGAMTEGTCAKDDYTSM